MEGLLWSHGAGGHQVECGPGRPECPPHRGWAGPCPCGGSHRADGDPGHRSWARDPQPRPEQAALLPLSRSRRPSSRRRRGVWAQPPKGIHQFLTAPDPQGFDAENRDRLGHIRVCDNRIPGEVHTRASLEDKAQGGAVKSDHAFRWREAYGINIDHFSVFGEHSAYPLPVPVLVGEPGGRNHREPLTLRRDEEAVLSLLGAKEFGGSPRTD